MKRKTFLSKLFSFSMAAGLVAGCGSFFLMFVRFIFPSKSRRRIQSPLRPGHDPVLYARPASKTP